MTQVLNPPGSRARARLLNEYFLVLAVVLFMGVTLSAFAQVTHIANPYAGATQYVNPDYAAEVNTAIAEQPVGSTLAKQMAVVATYPTAVWLDRIAAISGGSSNNGRLGLQGHINAALAQQAASGSGEPIVVTLVIYDLPDRDCAALASNGELSIAGGDTPQGSTTPLTGTGLQEYENYFITPIYKVLASYATNANIRFVLVIEDDSLPNMITNTGLSYALPNCIAANGGQSYPTLSMNGVYVLGIQYALNKFHSIPNVYNYLDIGHHGWLGWPVNSAAAYPFFFDVANGTTDGVASVDGFITNTANYGPTKEPYMTATEEVGGAEVYSSTFYQWDPQIDEEGYAAEFDSGLIAAGFPSTLGFLIDTSRNGWGGTLRPTAASTSSVLDTFVDATKIDLRDDMGQWCNQSNAGLGVPPTENPGGFTNLSAYVWIKPPGESDGNYPGSVYNDVTSNTGDANCDPAHDNALANNMVTGAMANSPSAGVFWPAQFAALVQNAYPAVPASTAAGFSIAASSVSVEQGVSATSGVTVTAINGFNSAVALTVSGLPTGVTANFSPTSVTASAGSTLTFTASAIAMVGASTVTVTGTSGSITESTTLTLSVTAEPNFTLTASPTAVSVLAGTSIASTITIGYVGGLTGSVALSASNVPSSVSVNFSPSSVNASGTVSVSFYAQTGAAAGTTNVTITGTDGSITHSAVIAVTIPSSSSFKLASSPASLSVTQGSTAAAAIAVTDSGGFSGGVTLAASGLPTGVTATFGANPTTGTSAVNFNASSTAIAGTSTITITGASGSLTASTAIALTVATTGGAKCNVDYTISNQWPGGFGAAIAINNTGGTPLTNWTLTWAYTNGQTVPQLWNGNASQSGSTVTVTNMSYNGAIAAGGSVTGIGFNGTWNDVTNSIPTVISLNGTACSVNSAPAPGNPPTNPPSQSPGYWRTSGNKILDANGNEVRIAGVNWYGFETPDYLAHGLWAQDYKTVLNTIQTLGYNVIRIPFSNEMVESNPVPTNFATYADGGAVNQELVGQTALTDLDTIISYAGSIGLHVILDNHRSEAGESNEANGLWYTSAYSQDNWIADWQTMATRYSASKFTFNGNPTVIGFDLRNEPHLIGSSATTGSCWTGDSAVNGCPVSLTAQNWPVAAELAGNAVLTINPNVLIFVEGNDCYNGSCGWQGGNLMGVANYPLTLSVADQLVYSAHDYGPNLYEQSWFNSSTTPASLNATWNAFWGYISANGIAPVWLGEFGTDNTNSNIENTAPGSQGQWFESLVSYLQSNSTIGWTYWALNGEDAYALLDSNYDATPVSSLKQSLLETIQSPLSTPSTQNFTLTPSASSLTISQSSTATDAITVTAVGGFSGSVTLTTSGLPTGVTATSVANPTTGSSVVTFTANSTATAGISTVTITGVSGSLSNSTTIILTVVPSGGATCTVDYTISNQWPGGFGAAITINNTGAEAISSWTLTWTFANEQTVTQLWNGNATQNGSTVTVNNLSYNGAIAAGGSVTGIGLNGTWNNIINAIPTAVSLNGIACTVN
jgi:cellulase/cellobiase CelA1/aryl-phospho-beta-D-glucosidase BglC (GH1 family)